MNFENPESPLVSVLMLTYMHEFYISESIQKVLDQKTDFPIELIIADDCSPDETHKVVQQFVHSHPKGHLIRYFRHQVNKGMAQNFVWALEACTGKYIAICEGDDFWHNSSKLQIQVDYLEKNEDHGLLFTDFDLLNEKSKSIVSSYNKLVKRTIPVGNIFQHLLYDNPFVTCTSMFRRVCLKDFHYDFESKKIPMRDASLWLHIAAKWKVGYIDQSTATYRVLENSASHYSDFNKEVEFRKSSLRVSEFYANHYGVKFDYRRKEKAIKSSLIKSLIQKNQYKYLLGFSDQIGVIFTEIFKEKLVKPIIYHLKVRK